MLLGAQAGVNSAPVAFVFAANLRWAFAQHVAVLTSVGGTTSTDLVSQTVTTTAEQVRAATSRQFALTGVDVSWADQRAASVHAALWLGAERVKARSLSPHAGASDSGVGVFGGVGLSWHQPLASLFAVDAGLELNWRPTPWLVSNQPSEPHARPRDHPKRRARPVGRRRRPLVCATPTQRARERPNRRLPSRKRALSGNWGSRDFAA